MPKKRRVYISRVVGNQVMTSADLERLHKYMLEIEESLDHACTPRQRQITAVLRLEEISVARKSPARGAGLRGY
jgi:hypothetical protein